MEMSEDAEKICEGAISQVLSRDYTNLDSSSSEELDQAEEEEESEVEEGDEVA